LVLVLVLDLGLGLGLRGRRCSGEAIRLAQLQRDVRIRFAQRLELLRCDGEHAGGEVEACDADVEARGPGVREQLGGVAAGAAAQVDDGERGGGDE